MNKKIIGILVCMLLIITAVPAVGTMNEKENPETLGICSNSLGQINTRETTMSYDRGSLFIQTPRDTQGSFVSDTGSGWKVFDDFWDIASPICDIHWWGQCLKYTDEWYNYDPSGMTFKIEFYSDNNSKPGDLLCSYDSISPTPIPTGIWYHYEPRDVYFELYYFETDLEPCCQISNGWVSIESTYVPSGGWFMWFWSLDGNRQMFQSYEGVLQKYFTDASFVLTDDTEDPTPDLECDGELDWTDVPIGSNVSGDFVVRNNGDTGSILHWKVESYPNWGSNWTFTPNASVLTIGDDWITIDVEAIAPEDKNEEFTGEVKLVNVMDPSDSCTIDVSLVTPKNKPFIHNFPIFSWLFV